MPNLLAKDGYTFVPANKMRDLLTQAGSLADWDKFSASWEHLAADNYMADKGRYRKRRYGVFHTDKDGTIHSEPHQAHYQKVDYNPLNGGVERWFEPIVPEIAQGESMMTILRYCRELFGQESSANLSWHIEVHQFRIEARLNESGYPTPEGMHRDGVEFVLVLMIRRQNIVSGETTIHDLTHHQLGSFILTQPFDAALVDDQRVLHGVTPVTPLDPSLPAFRDVLVVTFRRL